MEIVRDDGKQDVDGHERSTSTFIIRISDKIKFCNQIMLRILFMCLAFREIKLWTYYGYECVILVYS
jgi:hypothetical protein